MGLRSSKEESMERKLLQERKEAIRRQRYYELFELRQDWQFVFGDEVPKQKKDVLTIRDMTPRDVWMEDMYLFKQIVACRPDELFHPQSEYALKWSPPGSNFKLLVPFDNPAMQEAVIIHLSRLPKPLRKMVLFHFGPRDPNQTMFREEVHPASLVSYHHKNEVLQKLCQQFLENRMDIDEFRNTIGSAYDVWKRAMYNMLPEDEQVYHTYLTELPEAEPSVKVLDNEYLEGRITLQEYEDLKFPERKRRKDAELLKYPLPVVSGPCNICHDVSAGIIQCNVCTNKVCVECIYKKFHRTETKEGSYLLIHRRFCLRLAALKPMHVEVQMAPAYLRELRATGQTAALRMLAEETKPPPEEEEVEEVDEEDEEERRHRLEMQRIKEEREFKAMMKENPPALQALTKLFEKVDKKFLKIRKEALEQQVRIDEPGHSDFFVDRLVRLKNECLEKIGDVVSTPSAALLEKAVALDLPESVTCKAFVERLNVVLQESKWLLEMTSMQHFEDLHNGVTVEERAVIIAEQKRVEREAREEKRAAEAAAAATVAGDIEGSSATEGVARSGTAEPEGHGNDQRGHDSRKHPHEEQSLEADAVVHSMASGKAKSHKHKSHKHNHDTDRAGAEVLEEHWQRPDAKTRMENKKNLHKHHPDAAQQASINAAQIEGEAYVQDAGDNA